MGQKRKVLVMLESTGGCEGTMSLRISLGLFTKILWMFKEFKQFFMLNSCLCEKYYIGSNFCF